MDKKILCTYLDIQSLIVSDVSMTFKKKELLSQKVEQK